MSSDKFAMWPRHKMAMGTLSKEMSGYWAFPAALAQTGDLHYYSRDAASCACLINNGRYGGRKNGNPQ